MFNALVVNKDEESGKTSAAVEQISTDQLPEGNVAVNVEYSTVNYKDGLCIGPGGGLVREYPHVPGIDFAGTVERLNDSFGASIIALSDTIGCADSKILPDLYKNLITSFPKVEFGAHLHVNPLYAQELISASYEGGCMRFDTAMKGFGGCPMAKDDLTGNLPTEELIKWINKNNMKNNLDQNAVSLVMNSVSKVFESTQ